VFRHVARQHFFEAPALQLGDWARCDDTHGVPELGLALFIMRVKLFRDAHHAAILRVLHETQHFDHDGLFHLGAGHATGEHLMLMARIPCWVRSGVFRFGAHFAFLGSCDRIEVFAGRAAVAAAAWRADAEDFSPRGLAFNSCARSSVFTRARSFLASRSRLSASACPVVN
jgi:hypothetical protein